MHIRRGTLADVDGIAAAHVAAWRAVYPGIVAQDSIDRRTVEVRTTQWDGILRGERQAPPIVFVAEHEGKIAGFISGGPIREARAGFDAELYAIYLIKPAQGSGVGRRLVERLAAALVRDGFRSMVVEVLARNPACQFYERLGARLLEENEHPMDGEPYPGRLYGWDDITVLGRASDRLIECTWPRLDDRHDRALRDAVAFVFDLVDPVAVVATGTIIRGVSQATSDLDIYVVHDAPHRRRIQRFFNGVPAEIFINPPQAVRSYFHDEHADARPITAHMLATGVVVWSTGPTIDKLRAEAVDWLARPSSLSSDQIIQARYVAATKFEDALDVAIADAPTSWMLMTQAVTVMLELECRMRSGRVPRGKDLLASIAELNPELGLRASIFFSNATEAERRAAAESIAGLTIGARGFFEWDSGPGPVPPSIDETIDT